MTTATRSCFARLQSGIGRRKAGEELDTNEEVTNVRGRPGHVDVQFLSGFAVCPAS